ncbi:MAG: ABC transporter ATP-binding protein, partial [Clostridia bacterium]|nr:ABC transporter ATP-binding protein [Clostridia bacterium]
MNRGGGMGPGSMIMGDPRNQKNPNNTTQRGKKLDPKTRKKVLSRLSKYLFKHMSTVLLAFILMLSANLLALVGPKLSGEAINAIVGEGKVDFDIIYTKVTGLIICYFGSALLSLGLALTLIRLSKKITYSLRKDIFEHLLTLPVGYFDTHQTGDIISHISYDVDTVNTSLSHDLLQICASIVTVVGSVGMMLMISPMLLLVFCVTVPISLVLTKKRTTFVRPLFRKRSAKLGELNGYAEEMLSGQKTIRAYGRQDHICDKFDERNKDACDAYYEADYHGALIGPSTNFINNLSLSLIIMFGGIFLLLSITGVVPKPIGHWGDPILSIFFIEIGYLSSFVQYSRRFAGPINEFANILADLQSALSAAERIFRIIDEDPETPDIPNAIKTDSVHGEVKIDHVKFGYVPDRIIIKDLSLDVPQGSTVAIVGPTGAGKTTIINLLMRFYDVNEGKIYLDGSEIRDYTRHSLRSAYTMVLQETWLFGGTIAENIAYGKEGATMDEIVEAAKA